MTISLLSCVIANPFPKPGPSLTHTHTLADSHNRAVVIGSQGNSRICSRLYSHLCSRPVTQHYEDDSHNSSFSLFHLHHTGLIYKNLCNQNMIDVSPTLRELIIFSISHAVSLLPLLSPAFTPSPLLLFPSSSRHFPLLTLPHSRLTFLTSPFNRLGDKRSLTAPRRANHVNPRLSVNASLCVFMSRRLDPVLFVEPQLSSLRLSVRHRCVCLLLSI